MAYPDLLPISEFELDPRHPNSLARHLGIGRERIEPVILTRRVEAPEHQLASPAREPPAGVEVDLVGRIARTCRVDGIRPVIAAVVLGLGIAIVVLHEPPKLRSGEDSGGVTKSDPGAHFMKEGAFGSLGRVRDASIDVWIPPVQGGLG